MDPISPLAAPSVRPVPIVDPAAKTSPEITRAAKEFESMVLTELLRPMFQNLGENDPFNGGAGEQMFRPMLVDQYAKAFSNAGGIGIAEAVQAELIRIQSQEPALAADR